MNLRTAKEQKGFTIIEVVLVLAIAGLIFLIVFLALPQLQKSRRDTQRRNDLGRMMSALETYSSSSNGTYPTSQAELDSFKTTYISTSNLKDPSTGNDYTLTFQTTAPGAVGTVSYSNSAACGTNGALSSTSNARQVAMSVKLETGFQCQANQ